jgi:uncharacterized protein
MGHSHTPEEHCGDGGFCAAHGGIVASDAERVSGSPQTIGVRLTLGALQFYKAYFSMLVGGSCRFVPTCSMYAYQAVERFGVAHGAWLTLKRLLRCHPLSRKFGYDPVPEVTPRSRAVTSEEAHS